jgi:hypothetical protein
MVHAQVPNFVSGAHHETLDAVVAPEAASLHLDDAAVLHFNWEQRAQALSCMQTLVMALADDPVNSYFSGSMRKRFVKEEVGALSAHSNTQLPQRDPTNSTLVEQVNYCG